MSRTISADESLARCIFFRSHFWPSRMKAKPAAFEPMFNEKKNRWEKSMACIEGLTEEKILEIGIEIGRERNLLPKAHADITPKEISTQGLSVESTTEKYPWHADIINWPNEESEQLDRAIELAKIARLKLFPSKP